MYKTAEDSTPMNQDLLNTILKDSSAINSYSDLSLPAYLMCPPFSYVSGEANNIWMETKATHPNREVDSAVAFKQWQDLYQFMVSEGAFVHLMHAPRSSGLKDLVYAANAGIIIRSKENEPMAVVSNFTSEPRHGETPVIEATFHAMGYKTMVCPFKFEGEADLKHLYGNVYIGGYGIRSNKESYDWMKEQFGVDIICVHMTDDYLYHLDCSIFPLTHESTLVCTELYTKNEIKAIEKVTEIIPVSKKYAYLGITNAVKINSTVMMQSSRVCFSKNCNDENAVLDGQKCRFLEKECGKRGLSIRYFDLEEYTKGGGLLSCLIMHLN